MDAPIADTPLNSKKTQPCRPTSPSLDRYGLSSDASNPVMSLLPGEKPFYATNRGAAFLGDALALLPKLPDESISLIVTSPPFALVRKKPYGNVDAEEYCTWFEPFANQFRRVLRADGSLVLDIGGSWVPGLPVKSTYQFELLLRLTKSFFLAQDFYWYNPARLPSPAEWANVRRIRAKDCVDCIWWMSRSPFPKANNRMVLQPYSESMKVLMERGVRPADRPSGHEITRKFERDNKGSIPGNFLVIANTDSASQYLRRCRTEGLRPHPARFPRGLPEFFTRFLTEPGDFVLDPFAGSNTTGEVAESLSRSWIAIEKEEEYLKASRLRFAR
jgi:DNA modification methylase